MVQINWDTVSELDKKIQGRYNANDPIFIYAYVRDRDGNIERVPYKSKAKDWRKSLYHITEMRNIKSIVIADRNQNTLTRMEISSNTPEVVPGGTGDSTVIERFAGMTPQEREVWAEIMSASITHFLQQGD
jgi:hypothetical protein